MTGHFHFIGAGGIGMSGLAKLMLHDGAQVSGSDMNNSTIIRELCSRGAKINIGHSERIPAMTDIVVVSAAIKDDNPELLEAKKRGLKIFKYAAMLGEIMDRYDGVAISGTHGKSTTCGWLTYLLHQSGYSPNFVIGADIIQLGDSSGYGQSSIFIAEACEYDRSFLNLRPKTGVILNIEADHLDYYRDENEIVEAFAEFAAGVRSDGSLLVNAHDPNAMRAARLSQTPAQIITIGMDYDCDYSAQNINLGSALSSFDLFHHDNCVGSAKIRLAGKHNVYNALAVCAAAIQCGLEPQLVLARIGDFTGMDRRMMLKANINGINICDDYAHHPTEIRASLKALRQRFNPARIICIFQPHQYSRTRFLLDDFAGSFTCADLTIVPEIYFVRDSEASKQAVNAQKLVDKICQNSSSAIFIDSFSGICEYLKNNARPGDLVVTMGAGDIWKVADEYIQWLGTNRSN